MRWHLIIALAAFGALLVGSGVWLRASLAESFTQGEAYGRALAAAEAAVALTRQNAALETVRRGAEEEAATLEIERDRLQEKRHELQNTLTLAGGDGIGGSRPCLDAGVVRALNAIGGVGSNPRAP